MTNPATPTNEAPTDKLTPETFQVIAHHLNDRRPVALSALKVGDVFRSATGPGGCRYRITEQGARGTRYQLLDWQTWEPKGTPCYLAEPGRGGDVVKVHRAGQ